MDRGLGFSQFHGMHLRGEHNTAASFCEAAVFGTLRFPLTPALCPVGEKEAGYFADQSLCTNVPGASLRSKVWAPK